MTELLTDDEVVAIAAHESAEFPVWLPTVARNPGEMMGGILRGSRSLLIRGLATEEKVSGLIVADRTAERLSPFIGEGWRHRCFFYATVMSLPVAAGGAKVFADNGIGHWYLDEVSSFGIHSIRGASCEEFETNARAFLDMNDSRYPAGGGLGRREKAITVYSEGLSKELIAKTEKGFYLAGAAGRDDLPVAIPESEFAFRRIDEAEAAGHLGVAAR